MLSATRLLQSNAQTGRLIMGSGKLQSATYTNPLEGVNQQRSNSYIIFNNAEGRSRMAQSTLTREGYSGFSSQASASGGAADQGHGPIRRENAPVLRNDGIPKPHVYFEPLSAELRGAWIRSQSKVKGAKRN